MSWPDREIPHYSRWRPVVCAFPDHTPRHSTSSSPRFPRRKLESLLDELPHLEKRLLGVASNELVQAQDQMVLLGRKTAREKVVSFLLSLSRRQAETGGAPSPVAVPMSRADIADYLGLTTETVSRTFSSLKRGQAMLRYASIFVVGVALGLVANAFLRPSSEDSFSEHFRGANQDPISADVQPVHGGSSDFSGKSGKSDKSDNRIELATEESVR